MTWALVKPASGYRIFSRFVSLSVRSSIRTSTGVSLATFAHDLSRGLVRTQSLEGGRPQLSGSGPFHELELCHELRLEEVGGLRWRAHVERVGLHLERLHQGLQLVERRVGEAGPDLAGIDKLSVPVVADQQRARLAAALAFPFQPASDDQLLPVAVLDLDPGSAPPPGLVRGVELLGHDPLEARLHAGLEHRLAAALLGRRRLP